MNERKLVINPDGTMHVEETKILPVSGAAKLLKSLSEQSAVCLPAISPDAWLVMHTGRFRFFQMIDELRVNTIWTSAEEEEGDKVVSFLHPNFSSSGGSELKVKSDVMKWKVPSDMALLWISGNLTPPSNPVDKKSGRRTSPRGTDVGSKCGLIALDMKSGDIYRLPLPNVYENGTLCTGPLSFDQHYPLTGGKQMFGSWEANTWNADLIEYTHGKYKDLIRLDPKTGNTLPSKGGDWRANCYRVNTNGWLPEAVLAAGINHLQP
jgi:hypothetical protein